MKQYCRYCCHLVVGDVNYCTKHERTMSDTSAKALNHCRDFAYNPMDAFLENEKGYTPRQPKKPKKEQCDGQISLFDMLGSTVLPVPVVEVNSELLPCDDCIFGSPGGCEYNTRNCYCVNGDKQIRQDSGWKLVDKGKNLPPCTGNWQDYDVLIYYSKIDDYTYEVWEYKDWTFRSKDKYDAAKGSGSVVAWKKKEAEDHDFSRYIAEHLIELCNEWGYDWIEKLKEDKTVENFYKLFCRITKTYYFYIGEDYYGVNFSKDGNAEVYKCGKQHENVLRTVSIQEIVDKLPSKDREKNQCLGEPCASCDVEWCSIKCFERRGYMWDRFHRFLKDENGNKLRKALEDRECKKEYE